MFLIKFRLTFDFVVKGDHDQNPHKHKCHTLYTDYKCVIVPWIIITGAIGFTAFTIVSYNVELGKQKSEEWLSSFLLSIVESILILDPLLVRIWIMSRNTVVTCVLYPWEAPLVSLDNGIWICN